MVRIWIWAAVAVILELSALSSATGQNLPLLCDAEARAYFAQAGSLEPRKSGRRFNSNLGEMPLERGRIGRANGPAAVFYIAAVELGLAAATAVACWLTIAIAGICLRISERRARQRINEASRWQLVLRRVETNAPELVARHMHPSG
jgi:hypothetical protein